MCVLNDEDAGWLQSVLSVGRVIGARLGEGMYSDDLDTAQSATAGEAASPFAVSASSAFLAAAASCAALDAAPSAAALDAAPSAAA